MTVFCFVPEKDFEFPFMLVGKHPINMKGTSKEVTYFTASSKLFFKHRLPSRK